MAINKFIPFIDAKTQVAIKPALEALGTVPFLQHQFGWLVRKLAGTADYSDFRQTLCGYVGVKKITETRDIAMRSFFTLLRDLAQQNPAFLASMPDRLTGGYVCQLQPV